MKRTYPTQFPFIQVLLVVCLLVLTAAAQTSDPGTDLSGQWQGDIKFKESAISLTVVLSRANGRIKTLVFNFGRDKCFTELAREDTDAPDGKIRFQVRQGLLKGSYEGEVSADREVLKIKPAGDTDKNPKSDLSWNLVKVPVCNDPGALYSEARHIFKGRNYETAERHLKRCVYTGLFEDKVSLINGMISLGKARYHLASQNYQEAGWNISDSTTLFSRSFTANESNLLALEAGGYAYSQLAAMVPLQTAVDIEKNAKNYGRYAWTPQMVEQKKAEAKRLAITYLDNSIARYSSLIYNDQFNFEAYVRRAQAYYAKWSKYDPDPEYLKIAIKDYKSAIDLNPLSSDLFYERAMIYSYLGDEEHSETDLRKAAELKVNKLRPLDN